VLPFDYNAKKKIRSNMYDFLKILLS
jgi:hypothetical protein